MQILFRELFANAVRFSKERGQASLSVHVTMLQLNRYRHIEDRYEYIDFVRIQVIDYGKGFDNRFKDQAFELFRKLHAESGSGVGLALSKKIVDNHFGDISIEGKIGEETTVTIQIPLAGITPVARDHIPLITDQTHQSE